VDTSADETPSTLDSAFKDLADLQTKKIITACRSKFPPEIFVAIVEYLALENGPVAVGDPQAAHWGRRTSRESLRNLLASEPYCGPAVVGDELATMVTKTSVMVSRT
jgi:hypothetical protein